ncbi:TIGR01212 family radical SAM protein [Pelagicoccus mobilis]|uniref:TIGR01212 family radical SAM protein n=1 Tax=Pelagicoccus mobilis TaxID=415221 RepID=A0A934VRJ5_9BACT|nr:TIGR01212 family radical SAM protein [Pelagicoccus mobilis]MBK1878015.1 TIGR01212 family radical SAM protein [Pelagicoccus mobilis]
MSSPWNEELLERFYPKRYNAYGPYLKRRLGAKVFKVVVDAGFTCPNRDGTKGWGGCAYCNVDSFTPRENRKTSLSVREQVLAGIERARQNYGAEKFIVYFQPNTNTYAPVEQLEGIYSEAIEAAPGAVLGLTIGTRPDCIDREKLEMLKRRFGDLYVSIEYGLESMRDDVLEAINRGATHAEFVDAVRRTAEFGFEVCAHTIFGLPGEDEGDWLRVADELNRLPVRFVKLHHLHVVRGSILAKRYRDEPFELFSLEAYASFLERFLARLSPDIVVQRLFGLADQEDLIAPNWGLKKTLIQRELERSLVANGVVQGMSSDVAVR